VQLLCKTETGSASGPVLFTSCEMVYNTGLKIYNIQKMLVKASLAIVFSL